MRFALRSCLLTKRRHCPAPSWPLQGVPGSASTTASRPTDAASGCRTSYVFPLFITMRNGRKGWARRYVWIDSGRIGVSFGKNKRGSHRDCTAPMLLIFSSHGGDHDLNALNPRETRCLLPRPSKPAGGGFLFPRRPAPITSLPADTASSPTPPLHAPAAPLPAPARAAPSPDARAPAPVPPTPIAARPPRAPAGSP